MEIKLQIFPDEKLVLESISGEVTLGAMIQKTKALFENPDYNPSFVGVIDFRRGITHMSKVELLGFANLINDSEQFGHAPWAILADDPMVVALSQIFQLRVKNPENIGVFTTVREAAKYVQRPKLIEYLDEYPCI
jgi:hypothetical protein